MQKDMDLFLRKFGIIQSQIYHKSEENRSGRCFELKPCGISLPTTLFLTVTVRSHLLLEVLHKAPGVDDALEVEILPLNASLPSLQLRLQAIAAKASRQYVKDLASDSFWEDEIEAGIEMLVPEIQDSLVSEIEAFHQDLKELRSLIAKNADVAELIEIHNKLDSFDDRLTQMRLSR